MGFYTNAAGSVACAPCPPGSYRPNIGTTAAFACEQGLYCPSGSAAPVPCPSGSYCKNAAGSPTPCPKNTFSVSEKGTSETICFPCSPGEQSSPGSSECSAPCIPSPFNFQTFNCFSTQTKVLVVFSWCATVFSAVFFPFKMWAIYKKRKAKLTARGVPPTLVNIIFYRSALSRAVTLQPLINAQVAADP